MILLESQEGGKWLSQTLLLTLILRRIKEDVFLEREELSREGDFFLLVM